MKLWSRMVLWLSVLALASSGVLLEWLKPVDEFALPHPWNGSLRQLHGWACQLALISLGYMLADHIQKKWRKKTKHWDGLLNLILWLGLVWTGLWLYYPPEFVVPALLSQAHWYLGLGWLCVLAGHYLRYRLSLRQL